MTTAGPGLDRAIRVGDRDWYAAGCARAIKQLATTGRPFTADDVRDLVGESDDPHMIGVAFAVASRSKLIEVVSAVVGRDGRPARVWNATPTGQEGSDADGRSRAARQ